VISVIVGISAAYMGGIVDDGLSLLTDVVLVIPTFPLIIVIVGYLKSAGFWLMVFVLVFTGWSYGARQLRVQALSLRIATTCSRPRPGANRVGTSSRSS